MFKRHLRTIIFACVFFIGIIIIKNSVSLGRNEMFNMVLGQDELSNMVNFNGGLTSNTNYSTLLEQSIIKYRFVGTIFSALGGLGVLIHTSVKS